MMTQQDSESGNVAAATLDSCPQCSYKLRGLPANHQCPECGLAYDEHSAIWRKRPRKRELIITFIFPLSITYSLFQPARFLPEYLQVLFFIVVLLVLIFQTVRFWSLCRGGRFVAVMPHGIMLRMDKTKITCVPWTEIAEIYAFPPKPRAVIHLKIPENTIGVSHLFSTLADAKMFAICAESQRARHDSAN